MDIPGLQIFRQCLRGKTPICTVHNAAEAHCKISCTENLLDDATSTDEAAAGGTIDVERVFKMGQHQLHDLIYARQE